MQVQVSVAESLSLGESYFCSSLEICAHVTAGRYAHLPAHSIQPFPIGVNCIVCNLLGAHLLFSFSNDIDEFHSLTLEEMCFPSWAPYAFDHDPRNSSVTRTSSSVCVQISAWSAPSIMTS